jgi:hypothetical protein
MGAWGMPCGYACGVCINVAIAGVKELLCPLISQEQIMEKSYVTEAQIDALNYIFSKFNI